MGMRLLRIAAGVVLAVGLALGLAWLLRSDPIGPIPGKRLTGTEEPYPHDWRFTQAFTTIAVEARPSDPYSVTTLCFLHDGDLFVPSLNGSKKHWTKLVVADPRVRIKVGDEVYPARAVRVEDSVAEDDALRAALASKYPRIAARAKQQPGSTRPEVWFFRIEPR